MNTRFSPSRTQPPLHECTHDLLWALRSADEWEHLGVRLLGIAHPAGACACEHRELAFSALPLVELLHVFQEGNMPRECGIIHLCEAEGDPAEHAHAPENLQEADVL